MGDLLKKPFGRHGKVHAITPESAGWRYVGFDLIRLRAGEAWAEETGKGGHAARRIGPDGITLTQRGQGTNTRYINNIAMEGEEYCDSLLVTEVFTPAGHWSSYPSHRHDEDDYPNITYLEETYYHRLNPGNGFGIQRVYTDDGQLDETMSVSDGDVVLVPRGHHPCGAPYGIEMYYLNVMAGPRRNWRFVPAPELEHLL